MKKCIKKTAVTVCAIIGTAMLFVLFAWVIGALQKDKDLDLINIVDGPIDRWMVEKRCPPDTEDTSYRIMREEILNIITSPRIPQEPNCNCEE